MVLFLQVLFTTGPLKMITILHEYEDPSNCEI